MIGPVIIPPILSLAGAPRQPGRLLLVVGCHRLRGVRRVQEKPATSRRRSWSPRGSRSGPDPDL